MDMQSLQQLWSETEVESAQGSRAPAPGKTTLTSRLTPAPQVVLRLVDGDALRLGYALRLARAAAPARGRDDDGVTADAEVAVERAARTAGAPLPDAIRSRFEDSIGVDLAHVRIHTGAESAQAAEAVSAHAYTVGSDIHFGAGKYDPGDPFGLHLLAHEVAHTVQQAGRVPERQHKLAVSSPQDAAEADADRAADAMVKGAPVSGRSRRRKPRKAKRPAPVVVAGDDASAAAVPAAAPPAGELHRAVDPSPRDGELDDDRAEALDVVATAGDAVVRRQPKDNSYNRGELTWGQGGTALTEDEVTAWWSRKTGVITAGAGLIGKAAGFQGAGADAVVAKLEAESENRFDTEVRVRKAQITHFENQVDYLEDEFNGWWEPKRSSTQDAELADLKTRLAAAEAELEKLEDTRSAYLARAAKQATEIVGVISSYGGKGISLASAVNVQSQSLNPSMFESMTDASGKLEKALAVINLSADLLDRTALQNFQANPNFETAEAWGRHVGQIFKSASAFAEGLPMGWDSVIQGVMQMPAIVIDRFAKLVRKRYERIDAETKDHHGGAKLLEEGESG